MTAEWTLVQLCSFFVVALLVAIFGSYVTYKEKSSLGVEFFISLGVLVLFYGISLGLLYLIGDKLNEEHVVQNAVQTVTNHFNSVAEFVVEQFNKLKESFK